MIRSALRRLAEFGALTLFFRFFKLLVEHAVIGWTDEQIGHTLGISSPTVRTIVVVWGLPMIAAALCLSGWMYAFYVLRRPDHSAETSTRQKDAELDPKPSADALAGSADIDSRLMERIEKAVSTGRDLLSTWAVAGAHTPTSRNELIGWLTEASQITNDLSGPRWNIYSAELMKAMGPTLSEGKLYDKAHVVHQIMSNLLKAMRMELRRRS